MVLFIPSLIVAFIGGVIALAMPCCFSVLLPSYFASSFKRRVTVFRMTFIFGAGIALVLLPIALGASALAQFFGQGHSIIFVAGGFLMIFLGLWSLWGHGMLPQIHLPVNLGRSDASSVFTLGAFSGIASSCCAPVLAGILVLSALTASFLQAFFVGLAYVFGMVLPLLVISVIWDARASGESKFLQGRMVHFKLLSTEVEIHSSKLIAGIMFIVMGIVTVILGFTDTMLSFPGLSIVNIYEVDLQRSINNAFSTGSTIIILLSILAFLVLALLAGLVMRSRRLGSRKVISAPIQP